MVQLLWNIVVQPLVYMIELVFLAGWRLTHNPGIAIIGVSLAVNLFCLPLYKMADVVQEREAAKRASMQKWVDHIKRHFSGDQQYMILSAYYLEQDYHPIHALAGSLSLLLQIPFFTAAYSYLSSLELLRGASFLFLADLGAPDALFSLGGFDVNVMPIAMTLLNAGSTLIYTRGKPLRDKVQAYGLAAIFLWLLYDSPSGLVFYWTCNQLFSLIKNVFLKVLRHPDTWALAAAQAAVLGFAGYLAGTGRLQGSQRIALVLVTLVCFEALWLRAWRSRGREARPLLQGVVPDRQLVAQFLLAGLVLTLLLGTLIPSALIADAPTEFLDLTNLVSPLGRVAFATSVWAGVSFLWLGTFFFLTPKPARGIYGLVTWLLIGVAMVDYFLFGEGLGTISNTLVYDQSVSYASEEQLRNLLALAVVVGAAALVWLRWNRLVTPVLVVLACSLAAVSVSHMTVINTAYEDTRAELAADDAALVGEDGSLRQIYHLSRTERNVLVIFLDRAISGYVPFIMAERPELTAQFDGFVYYPNTISFGGSTNLGAPALYGGYEYTPQAMNARPDVRLGDKHDEALLLMPTLFSEAGYRTTVVDPPYAGTYAHNADLSIYDKLDNTEAINARDAYTNIYKARHQITSGRDINRRFFMYGLFKTVPRAAANFVYDGGNYLTTATANPTRSSLLRELSQLEVMSETTEIDDGPGGFVLLCNETTHEPEVLQLPDYEPADNVDNTGLEDEGRFTLDGRTIEMGGDESLSAMRLGHYHVNAAALLRLGTYFDWLREQGVWDNTRIILVADHGRGLEQFAGWEVDGHTMNIQNVNPLLMVKDFDATGFTTSDEFMTNADVPTLALAGLVDDAKNPATGTPVNSDEKLAHDQLITASQNWDTTSGDGYTFDTSDAPWYAVHDDIFDLRNWTRLEDDAQ